MNEKTKRSRVVALLLVTAAAFVSSCSNLENTESDALAVANNNIEASDITSSDIESGAAESSAVESGDTKACRTYGFKDWTLKRDEQTLTLTGEASMPTPSWMVSLHQNVDASADTIEFIMETTVKPGFANSVVTWIAFEQTIDISAANNADVVVKCAGEVVWNLAQG